MIPEVPEKPRPLHVTESAPCVGGTVERERGPDRFVLVAAFDVAAVWNGAPGWVILEVHADDVGVCRARVDPTFDPTILTRRWTLGPPEEDEPWIPAVPGLGRLGAKIGGRPGWLQDEPRRLRARSTPIPLLAQLDCETDALYEAQRSLLCDGALYLFGRFDAEGRPAELDLYWQF